MRFSANEHLFRLTTMQPINQSDREPRTYANGKKAVGMRTMKTLTTANQIVSVPFISAESVVHHLREALWLSLLQRYGLTLKDFRNPAGALLTYMMLNGGDTSIGRKLDGVRDIQTITAMPLNFPPFGAFGGTLGGTFFESFVRVSFVLPFIQALTHWQWYYQNAEPGSPLQPAPVQPEDTIAFATGRDDHPAISYFRHPAPMGPFWGSIKASKTDAGSTEEASSAATESEAPLTPPSGNESPNPTTATPADPKPSLALKTFDPMPHTFDYIPPGVPLAFAIQFAEESTPVLRGAVRYAFDHWINARHQVTLGAHVNRGFGLVQWENFPPDEMFPEADPFLEWLARYDARLQDLLHRFTDPKALGTNLELHPEPLFDLIAQLFAE